MGVCVAGGHACWGGGKDMRAGETTTDIYCTHCDSWSSKIVQKCEVVHWSVAEHTQHFRHFFKLLVTQFEAEVVEDSPEVSTLYSSGVITVKRLERLKDVIEQLHFKILSKYLDSCKILKIARKREIKKWEKQKLIKY